ncbi:hypothetical protein ACFFUE_10740 [Bergeyella porcorum]
MLSQTIYQSKDVTITYGHALAAAVGATLLYLMVPARKRKNLF